MFGGLNRLLVAAFLAGAALFVAPSVALACNGGTSAVNVYKECLPTGGGSKATGGGSSSGHTNTTSATPVSSQAAKVISHSSAKDRRVLSSLVHTSPAKMQVTPDQAGPVAAPSAIGSAFDLGSGPTALLVTLAAAAFLLLAGTTVRSVRQRRR